MIPAAGELEIAPGRETRGRSTTAAAGRAWPAGTRRIAAAAPAVGFAGTGQRLEQKHKQERYGIEP